MFHSTQARLTTRENGARGSGLGPERETPANSVRPRAISSGLLSIATLIAWTGAPAANWATTNWEWAPRVEGGYRYSDNYRLDLPGGEIEVSGAEADAQLTLRTVDPRTRFEITPRIRATYFPSDSDEDSTDYFLDTLFEDETPRRRTGFRAAFSREDVVRSELPSADIDTGLGDPDTVDSGRILQRNRRELIRLAPYFSYDLTQRYRTELAAHYTEANFDRNFEGAQQDFSELGASAALGFRVSERSSLLIRGLASQYETTLDADAYGAEAEWGTMASPTSRMYVRIGAQQTQTERGPSESSIIFGAGGQWQTQRNALFLDFTRNVGPVAAGTIVERHQLRMRIDHDVSERVALLLGARAIRDEQLGETGTYPTREYATAEAGFEWRLQRSFALTATYRYVWQEYADEPSDASANGFLIGVVYEPKRVD